MRLAGGGGRRRQRHDDQSVLMNACDAAQDELSRVVGGRKSRGPVAREKARSAAIRGLFQVHRETHRTLSAYTELALTSVESCASNRQSCMCPEGAVAEAALLPRYAHTLSRSRAYLCGGADFRWLSPACQSRVLSRHPAALDFYTSPSDRSGNPLFACCMIAS